MAYALLIKIIFLNLALKVLMEEKILQFLLLIWISLTIQLKQFGALTKKRKLLLTNVLHGAIVIKMSTKEYMTNIAVNKNSAISATEGG